jgi:N-acetylglutamate synthase-like GNAT family acetyltransferase
MDHRKIQFCEGLSPIPAAPLAEENLVQLQQLFDHAAFWARGRSLEDLTIAINHSHPVISVWDGQHLIGFARTTSDGIYRATIWDVVIHPEYRGGGLGRQLVQTLLAHPHVRRVERVYLMTTNHQRFYEKIGFNSNSSTTMVLLQTAETTLPALSTEITHSL